MRDRASRSCAFVVVVCVLGAGQAAAQRGNIWTNPKDGSEMVHVPAGTFKMGGKESYEGGMIHDVHVDAFYIGKYEITNRQFKKFVDANPQWRKGRVDSKYANRFHLNDWEGDTYPADKADHPVVCVSWFAAKAYCEWAGGRLPTEAEWEKAARGTDGRAYPWGSEWDRTKCNSASYWAGKDVPDYDAWKKWFSEGGSEKAHTMHTMKVGSFPAGASPYGVMDMAGNVWEWCSSKHERYPYRRNDGREDSSDTGSRRVLRGGSCNLVDHYCRAADRGRNFPPRYYNGGGGFRLCVSSKTP